MLFDIVSCGKICQSVPILVEIRDEKRCLHMKKARAHHVGPCLYGVRPSWVEDGGDGLQIRVWRVAVKVLS
jgi:hypothetical protein